MPSPISRRLLPAVASFLSVLATGCGSDDQQSGPPAACSVPDNSGCADGLECQSVAGGDPACFCSTSRQTGCPGEPGQEQVCEEVPGNNSGCFSPVHVTGTVFDLITSSPISGARVVARNANHAADSDVVVSDASGRYDLRVPTPRAPDGRPLTKAVTLRADAAGYVTFPLPPRVALPIQLELAGGVPLTVHTTATDIGLLALPNASGLGTVTGAVLGDNVRGTLVVAGGSPDSGGGVTGVASGDGSYAVFNVPTGSATVRGFKVGLQFASRTADVWSGVTTSGVDLESLGTAAAAVSGKIEIVNPGAGDHTSVILAVAETFDPTAARGEAPPGLRVGSVDGSFSISGVPEGQYVVLAAFENDFLVRDPDTSIGGTEIVKITVAGAPMMIEQSFKVTGSLDVLRPDKEERVGGTPTFSWDDDSGEDHYELVVFDAVGNKVWEDLAVPGVSGAKSVDVAYGGPPLSSGLLYQFRATSIKQGGAPVSRTEDLRGVFLYR
jgi:hypothetical protein